MRDYYCAQINKSIEGREISLCGWVNRRRDHGGVIFVDLRDRTGLAQVVFNPDNKELFSVAESLRNEYVLQVTGVVKPRPEGTVNTDLTSGEVELHVSKMELINKSKTPPFMLDELHGKVSEDLRLKYRYLDLRREQMQKNLFTRAKCIKAIRDYLESKGFLDIETPCLTKATPEGARDYLVPSRTHQGSFFALPQSPQIFKQLLMMSGFDKYYQVVKCFRDEDLRADRQPEFTQLDIETSFLNEEQIQHEMELMVAHVFKQVLNVNINAPFKRMTYANAIKDYGSDKPDLRIDLKLHDVEDLMREVDFKVFSGPANDEDSRVAALCVPGGAKLSRKEIDDYTKFVGIYKAKGLAYIKVNELSKGIEGLQSPIIKFLGDKVTLDILDRVQAKDGDIVFFGADKKNIVNEALGALRVKVAHDLNMVNEGWQLLWVTDFPMFEWDQDNKRWTSMHHPFTAPQEGCPKALEQSPGDTLSRGYDLVLNGTELGGGSIRIHKNDIQQAVFRILGIDKQEQADKFGFLLEALEYGAPQMGGIAFGIDRFVMHLCGTDAIRDVIAFPKTQSAACLLTDAPSKVSLQQLNELSIKLKKTD